MKSKLQQLNDLNRMMSSCTGCSLRSGCTQVVFGVGNPAAEIMFIGEAPGKKEDELGIPFVGSSGRILDKMFANINIKREDVYPHTKNTANKNSDKKIISSPKNNNFGVGVYLTNVCKCRPPENRDPLPEEVAQCWPWLEKQIKIIDPKIIVTLGKYALNSFLPNAKISQVHGKVLEIELPKIGNRKIFPIYHPAAARQNKKTRALFEEDFQKIPHILTKIKKESM